MENAADGEGGRQLTTALPRAISAAEERLNQTLTMVREAMTNPAVDADKAKVMAQLLNDQEDRWQAQEFNRDLNAAIMDMPVITKAGVITMRNKDTGAVRTQGRFARFEDIMRVVGPILQRNNLAVRFDVGDLNNMVTVTPILSHANGHTERGGTMRLPLDKSGAKNDVQMVGSAVKYGQRYTLVAMLNIVTEGTDDDGSLGKQNIDMPHERQVAVLEEAEEAYEQGQYGEWFLAQGVKDRAWLISAGHHNRLGLGLALPGADAAPPPPPPPAPRQRPSPPTPAPSPPPADQTAPGADQAGQTEKKKLSPREWVDRLKLDISKRNDADELDLYMDGKREALDRLKETDQALWQECDDAYRYRLADFLES